MYYLLQLFTNRKTIWGKGMKIQETQVLIAPANNPHQFSQWRVVKWIKPLSQLLAGLEDLDILLPLIWRCLLCVLHAI